MRSKERIEKRIEFWREMFSFSSKLFVLISSALVVDINTKQELSFIDVVGVCVDFFFLMGMIISLLKWNEYIEDL
ncbi:MAG: hypothetical protein DSY35_02275 [Desulfurobacterium sp.]|nr:MAG: hypothetical protein DSY35_02275 [Desulfurobacterium sp.]